MHEDIQTELSALYEISSIPTSQISHQELGRLVLDKATRLLGASIALLYRRGDDGQPLRPWAARGVPAAEAGSPPVGESVARLLDEGQPVIAEGVEAVGALGVLPGHYPACHGLCLPIRVRASVGALLCVFRLSDRPFTRADLALFNALTDRAGMALETLQLFAEAERRQRELEQEVAERERLERALKEQSERLEEMVGQRTAELNARMAEVELLNRALANLLEDLQAANRNLERTTFQLQSANTELESFSYSVSHDLRAPLRAVDGFSRILLEEHASELSPEAQRYLNLVRDNARNMGQLIDDLLSLSRLGRKSLDKQLVAPADIVRQALEDLCDEQEGRQVEISIGDLPACQADPVLLRQVYFNLLSNALKFTRRREVARIEVGCIPQPPSSLLGEEGIASSTAFSLSGEGKEERYVYFVRDNGVGFDMHYANKLFGVFQRLHRAEEYEGTGVGLAIVQRIIHRHGGRIWAEAEVDKGATFYFTI